MKPSCAQIFAADSGSIGAQQRRGDAQRFRGGVENFVQTLRVGIAAFGQLPGRLFDDVFVDGSDQRPKRFRAPWKIQSARAPPVTIAVISVRALRDLLVAVAHRNHAAAILIDHRQRAAGQVAEAVGEIGIVAADQRVVAEAAVLAEDHFAQQEVAQRVGAEHFVDGRGAHDVAARFAHFVVFKQQPAVRENAFGQRQAGGHQKRGPVHGVEADDFFADQMQVRGPQRLRRATALM